MEPTRITAPHLLKVQKELSNREPIFHRPELGTSREDLLAMTEEGFWEVGATGRRYSREFIINTLIERYNKHEEDIWETSDFYCQEIAENNYLLTYTFVQPKITTRRTTLWRRVADGWKIVYHQGTVIK